MTQPPHKKTGTLRKQQATLRTHPKDKNNTRQRIIKLASERYRAEGFLAVGIANLMADLGMTHGGFYAHFADKEALVSAACEEAFTTQCASWDTILASQSPNEAFNTLIDSYLSSTHLHQPEKSCFAAALAGEMARRDSPSRQAFTHGIKKLLHLLEKAQDTQLNQQAAAVILGQMVGSQMLARAVSDPQLSEHFLQAARDALKTQIQTLNTPS